MRKNVKIAIAAAGCAVAFAVAASEGAVKYRQNTMKAVGGHMGAIVGIIRGEVPHDGHLPMHANALAAIAAAAPSLFAAGTEGGDTLPAVWEEPEDFQAKLDAFKDATTTLKAAADAGEGVREALRGVGQACKGCHDDYRAE